MNKPPAVRVYVQLTQSIRPFLRLLTKFDDWLFNPFEPRLTHLWLCYTVAFVLFAILRPPFQSPDEWSHFGRIASVFNGIWCAENNFTNIGKTGLIELYSSKQLGDIPFRPEKKLSLEDIQGLKKLPFLSENLNAVKHSFLCDREWVKIKVARFSWLNQYCHCSITEAGPTQECGYFTTTAWQYPPLYYLFGANILSLAKYTSLSPYNTFYSMRFGTAIFSAGLWALAIIVLAKAFPITPAVCLAICGIPMLSFMCSAINPDAFLYPLVTLCAAFLSCGLSDSKSTVWIWYSISLCSAMLCKMTAIFIIPPLAVIVLLTLSRCVYTFVAFSCSTVVGLAGAVFFYYILLGSFQISEVPVANLSLIEYLTNLNTYRNVYKSFWGYLGWLDVSVSNWAYRYLWILVIIANSIVFRGILRENDVAHRDSLFLCAGFNFIVICWLIFVGHAAAVLANEYMHFDQLRWINQGRYFLPAVAFLLIPTFRQKNIISRSFLVCLIAFEFWIVDTMIYRYFVDGWYGWLKSLPFV